MARYSAEGAFETFWGEHVKRVEEVEAESGGAAAPEKRHGHEYMPMAHHGL
jgi:hypothetical protein